jgi:hypothetical protein
VDSGGIVDAAPEAASAKTITGKVFYTGMTARAVGVQVKIGNKATTTSADGSFSIDSVDVPYTLFTSYATLDGDTQFYIVDGLRRPDPTIEIRAVQATKPRVATVKGFVRGLAFPRPSPDEVITIAAVGDYGGTAAVTVLGSSATGEFVLNPGWRGPASRTMRIYGIGTSASGAPQAYSGSGFVDVVVSDEGTVTNVDLTLADLPSVPGSMQITQTVPMESVSSFLQVKFEPSCLVEFSTDSAPAAFAYPSLGIGSASLFVIGTFPAKQGRSLVIGNGPNAAMRLGTPIEVLRPAAGATLTANTKFEWRSRVGTNLLATDELVYVTQGNSVAWPSQVPLPSTPLSGGRPRAWYVYNYSTLASVDDFAVPADKPGFEISARRELSLP